MIIGSEKLRLVRTLPLAALLLATCFLAQAAHAAPFVVGTCMSGTHFTSISAAVATVPAGSTIHVCPGTYPEQVTINTSNLTLVGVESGTSDAAVVVAPSGGVVANATDIFGNPVAAQIFVQSATGVTIARLTVDGSANSLSSCATGLDGIYFQNSSGTVTDSVARNQILAPADLGCELGLGIIVESNTGTPAVTISNNSVRNYQKNGITADGPGNGSGGPNVTVTGNTVIGIGANPSIAQNGIQVGFGATGIVQNNHIADDIYTGSGAQGAGVLIYASGNVTVTNNTIESTQFGVSTATDPTYGPANGTTVTSNHIGGTQNFDAIEFCSNNNAAESNVIYGSAQSGVHADDSCPSSGTGNTIEHNTINEACAGILEGPSATGNTVAPNTFFNVTTTVLTGTATCTPPTAASAATAAAVTTNSSAPKTHAAGRPSPYRSNAHQAN
jgi:Right handed beta helix region